jgi:predicted PurR-regulated permease PerM
VAERIDLQAEQIGSQLGSVAQGLLNRTFGITRNMFTVILGYVVVPFWLFYVLKDRHQLGPAIKNWFPPALRTDVDNCIEITRRAIGSYVRAQLTLGLFIGVVTTLGLWALGIPFNIILGLIAGVTELIPVIGPILGAVPAIIVTIALEPEKTVWVVLFYLAVQQIENAVLVPRIQGNAVNVHPAVIIVLLVVAQQLWGFFGMVIIVPLAAATRDLYKYIYGRLREREQELSQPRVYRIERPRILPLPRAAGDATPADPGGTSRGTDG